MRAHHASLRMGQGELCTHAGPASCSPNVGTVLHRTNNAPEPCGALDLQYNARCDPAEVHTRRNTCTRTATSNTSRTTSSTRSSPTSNTKSSTTSRTKRCTTIITTSPTTSRTTSSTKSCTTGSTKSWTTSRSKEYYE